MLTDASASWQVVPLSIQITLAGPQNSEVAEDVIDVARVDHSLANVQASVFSFSILKGRWYGAHWSFCVKSNKNKLLPTAQFLFRFDTKTGSAVMAAHAQF